MSAVVLVPGYGGRLRAIERWRIAVAMRTLAIHGGGRLVVTGHGGEAERLAALAPPNQEVILEPTARNTWENVARCISELEHGEPIAVASDVFHARRAGRYLHELRPDLASRLVRAERLWWSSWWIHAAGAVYAAVMAVLRLPDSRTESRVSATPNCRSGRRCIRQSVGVPGSAAHSAFDVVELFGAACNAHDLEAAIDLCAEDIVFESTAPPDGERVVGRAGLRGVWTPIFENSKSHVEVEETIVSDDRVVQRVRYSWGDGHVRAVDVYRVTDGRISEKFSYVKG